MADNQTAQQTSQQQQQQQHGQVAQQQHQQQQAAAVPQRQISQNQPQTQPTQNQQAQQQPNTIQQQQQQQQPIQPTQQQPIQQQQVQQQQQQIQQLPQLQQIAPQQPQHVMSNLQGHTMTSVPLSMAMGTNPIYNNIGSMRPQQLGQLPQVQVIHQAMQSPPYLPQFYNQQLMLQNMQAAMQANMVNMNPQQINMANMVAMQGRPNTNMFAQMSQGPATPTTPNLISISSGANTSLTQLTSTAAGTANTSKPVQAGVNKQQSQQQGTLQQQQTQQQQGNQQQQQQQAQIHTLGPVQQAQATAMVGGKPIILGQATGSLLQGQLGVISAGQIPTSQAYTGQAFGQIQSKTNQQIGVNNAGQGQSIQMSSQSTMRFSQPQMIASNAGNAQLITSPITNQMLQAMASQLQQYPQQPIMSAQGQSPTIIAGQGLYIRSANPVQAQGLMAGVQTAINPNFKGTNQQTVQNVALPIQKQTTAAQTGKVLLPSVSKAVTAKVLPSNASATVKTGNQAMAKPKGRPKGVAKVTTPVSSASNEVPIKSESPASNASKPSTPTNQTPALPSHDTKNQSDSDNELGKKLVVNEDQEDVPEENEEKQTETKMTESITEKESPAKQDPVPEPPPVEKQRAIVKPHILTHVIEGFVIQEGPEPFPVQRSSLMTEFIPPKPGQPVEQSSLISMEDEDMDQDDTTSVEDQGSSNGQKMLRCECCNGSYPESKFNPTQRFCSKSCAKRYNVGCSKRLQHFPGRPKDKGRVLKRKRHGKGKRGVHGNRLQSSSSTGGGGDDMDMEDQSSSMSQDESPSPSTTPDHRLHTPPPELQLESDLHVPLTSPTKWNVQDVYEFVKALPGCSTYADEFKSQEIDGQALLLLKEDHLMTTMNMKLGPALKICARINAIKEETG